MKKLMFAIFGVALFLAPKNLLAQEAIILAPVEVTSECDYYPTTYNGNPALLEVCSTCVNGDCHVSEINIIL